MSVTLRILLIVSSFLSFFLCVKKIKQSKLKVENSVTWMVGSIILILMSIFSNGVAWISNKLGFVSPVNFVFLAIIAFLLIQLFIDNLNITELNEKIKSFGFENLDFNGNLGHTIEKDRNNRIYFEKDNDKKLTENMLFTFEPHIRMVGKKYGFKFENIYYFENGSVREL